MISLKDCNDLAFKSANDEKCTMIKMSKDDQVTSNLTLCVNKPANPKRGTEKGQLNTINLQLI